MCVTVYLMAGYAVPTKKVTLKQNTVQNYKELMKGVEAYSFKDEQVIYAVKYMESTCECGDEEGNGRKFERETFKPMAFDEDDMEIYEPDKQALLSKLKQVGLDKYATYGIYADTDIDCH